MEIALIIVEILTIIAVAVGGIFLYRMEKELKKNNAERDIDAKLIAKLEAEFRSVRDSFAASNSATVEALQSGMKSTNEPILQLVRTISDANEQKIGEMKEQLSVSLKDIKEDMEKNLVRVREDNARQLDAIRGTVDEKLTKTLDEKLNLSFKSVTDTLESLYKSLGELKTLDANVMDLNKILNGSKTRGVWGELSLESILDEILTPEQYEKQSKTGRRIAEAVDFAVILPGGEDGEKVYLPIDSKFPIEAYIKMNDALAEGDVDGYTQYRKGLAAAIRKQAGSIRDKYIAPPKTTDFAIMYLPSESLYAEVLRLDGIAEQLQRDFRVVVTGPINISALLNSLRIGFKTLQIQKNSNEVFKVLIAFRKEFENFIDEITRAQRQMETVQNTLSNAAHRTEKINKALSKVDGLKGFDDAGDPPSLI